MAGNPRAISGKSGHARARLAPDCGLTTSRRCAAKTIRVAYADWLEIIRLVERQGYRLANDNVGLAGEHVRLFADALAHGLNEEELVDPLRESAARVLDFVRGPGRDGFKMRSEWA
jgi:hypothetical protein